LLRGLNLAVNLCWQITNAMLLFTIFLSIGGLLIRLSHLISVKLKTYDMIYILFYLASFSAIFLQWLVLNALIMFPDISTTHDSMATWFKGAIWFLTLASTFLIYIGYNSLGFKKSFKFKYAPHVTVGLYILSISLLVLILITEITPGEIIDNSASFDFNPELTFFFAGLYGIVIGGIYAIFAIRSRLSLIDPIKKLIPFYRLYLGFPLIIGGGLILTGMIIVFDPITVPNWPCIRNIMTAFIYIGFLWFPTLESILETSYQSRITRLETMLERNKVLDLIDHDLANVTQILHTFFESIQLSDKDKEFLKSQIERMGKLITESRSIVVHDDDNLVEELMASYLLLRSDEEQELSK
jgi:hypothetical protein